MKRFSLILLLTLLPGVANATVAITTASWAGGLTYGSTITITLTGAGTKPNQAATYLFDNYENLAAGFKPSTWSFVTSYGDVQNVSTVTTNCFEGSGCAGNNVAMTGLSVFTANVSVTDVGAGGKVMESMVWYRDGTDWTIGDCAHPQINVKSTRWWAGGFKFNDFYSGTQCDGSSINFNENSNGFATTGIDRVYTGTFLPVLNTQQQVIIYSQLNSNASTNNSDGQFISYQNGVQVANTNTWRTNTSLDSANGRWALMYPIHMVFSNSTFPNSNVRWDNVMLETSWCAVWVTTVSTHMNSAMRYWLPVSSWSDTQVKVAFAQKLSANTSYYLYVQDNNLNINSSGLSILTGGSGGGAPTNVAPTVNAGSNQTIVLTATATITGTASDDGLPNPPNTLTTTWSKLSGPGSVTFGNTAILSTTAVFTSTGSYTLRLTADDSALQSTSDVVITVNAVVSSATGAFPWKATGP